MDRTAKLQFQYMAPEAQHTALHRLALSGLTAEQIAHYTGCPIGQARRALDFATPLSKTIPADWLARNGRGRGSGLSAGTANRTSPHGH